MWVTELDSACVEVYDALDGAAYPDMAEFYADLARVYREEIKDLADAGCRYLQIDEVNLAIGSTFVWTLYESERRVTHPTIQPSSVVAP